MVAPSAAPVAVWPTTRLHGTAPINTTNAIRDFTAAPVERCAQGMAYCIPADRRVASHFAGHPGCGVILSGAKDLGCVALGQSRAAPRRSFVATLLCMTSRSAPLDDFYL